MNVTSTSNSKIDENSTPFEEKKGNTMITRSLINGEVDAGLHREIIRMIIQYLESQGYHSSHKALSEEAEMHIHEAKKSSAEIDTLKALIREGNWIEADKLCSRPLVEKAYNRAFQLAFYKHQFLELIEQHESQKALTLLVKRLKPLEQLQVCSTEEFRDLSYLLSSSSVQDSAAFKGWEGTIREREHLIIRLDNLARLQAPDRHSDASAPLPPNRLLTLLDQAVQFQVSKCNLSQSSQTKQPIRLSTLLQDYSPEAIPEHQLSVLKGHTANVKAVRFVGPEGKLVASGSSDSTVRLWELNDSKSEILPLITLTGHQGRIWDLASTRTGNFLASASADRTVKIWDVSEPSQTTCKVTLSGHANDVYGVDYHPWTAHNIASSGYDRLVRLFDLNCPTEPIKVFKGHLLGIPAICFNPAGDLLITGSKDKTIKFWDCASGLCVKTLSSHLAEVTSVDCDSAGVHLLTSAKDNSNRLWDVRMLGRPIKKFKGHQNTSKHFVRARFAGTSLVFSGSEDGFLHLWNQDTCEVVSTLSHSGQSAPIYDAAYHPYHSSLVTCSEDSTLVYWGPSPSR
ncbi:hypothetical protein DSO57_1029535 [Entomophthora muscae]|uniref:Uncharacterized protein n=1 Tax=Entomophthora muscae TaxID=34485 RepID=A0ACC2T1E9_9FUNG|nr:hypothetical protein DSO57_1029535 [Entomophthora muscae]